MILRLFLCLLILLSGCRRGGTQNIPQPPERRIAVANGILAESNNAASKVIILLNQTGKLDNAKTANALTYTESIARASLSIAKIQSDGRPWLEQRENILQTLKAITPKSWFSTNIANLTQPDFAALEAAVSSIDSAVALIRLEVR